MYQTPRSCIQTEYAQDYREMNVLCRFKTILSREPLRFAKQVYGSWFAIFQLYAMLVFIPKLWSLVWPFMLENLTQLQIFTVGIITTNLATLITYNLILYFIYTSKIPFFEKYKVFKGDWPWQSDYQNWRQQFKATILNLAFNSLVIAPIYIVLANYNSFHYKLSMEQIPSAFTIAWQIMVFMVIEDFLFFSGHCLLHHPKMYWIHKKHHEYSRSVSIAAQYSHPIQTIINITAFGLGYKLLSFYYPVHVYATIVWTVLRVVKTIEAHSGYQWTFSYTSVFPIGGGAQYHDFHHSKNAGNFGGFFIFWDTIFGTNKQYFKWKKQEETVKKIESQNVEKVKRDYIRVNKQE